MKENLNILLVEDNILNQRITTFSLKKFNHTVDIANNGLEAVNKYRDNTYDVILMDIMMPNLNGWDTARRIRSMKRSDAERVPVIAMSANAFEKDVKKSLASGMNGHLSKPLDIGKLEKTLRKYLK